jgi:hypothetical protein
MEIVIAIRVTMFEVLGGDVRYLRVAPNGAWAIIAIGEIVGISAFFS